MSVETISPYLLLLKNRIDLSHIPFSERGARLLVMQQAANSMVFRLVERWFKLDNDLASYRQRPPIVENFRLTDGEGRMLEFTLESYPHRLDFLTEIGPFSLTFADTETLLLALPAEGCGVTFEAHMNEGQVDRRGGILRVTGNIRRNMAYTTNRKIVEDTLSLNERGNLEAHLRLAPAPGQETGLLINITPRLGFNRSIPSVDKTFLAAGQRWHDWLAAVPPVPEPYRTQYYYAWSIMRTGLISTRFYTTREAMTPSKVHYIGVWQWDAFFHALAYRHVDPQLAHDQLRVMLDHQRVDGMLPDAVHDEGTVTHLNYPVDQDVTKPPLLAWTAWKLYEMDGDREFLDEIYEPIVHLNDWWFDYNDKDGDGLCEYHHPYSSGADDSPLWDSGTPVAGPDLNTYLYLQMESLARIARVLGEETQAAGWQERANALLARMDEKMWDPEAGLYWPLLEGSKPIKLRTPFSLMPLLTGKLDPQIAARLVENLSDPARFWPRYPVPTVALGEEPYDPMVMWRGPTWVNINYLLQEGLERSGYETLAQDLRNRTLDMIMGYPDIFEYYNPETGEPGPKAATSFGWSAALFIEMVLRATRRPG
jgi:putative isomerase